MAAFEFSLTTDLDVAKQVAIAVHKRSLEIKEKVSGVKDLKVKHRYQNMAERLDNLADKIKDATYFADEFSKEIENV